MRRLTLIAVLALLAAAPAGAAPDPPCAAAPAVERLKVHHLRLRGDLDSSRLVRDFVRARDEAVADGAEVLLLELEADRFRPDVLLDLIRGLRPTVAGRPLRTLVWLNDPKDGRVGAGALALGLRADACYLGPRTVVASEPGDELWSLAPEGVEREETAAALGQCVHAALKDLGASPLLAAAVPLPSQLLWAVLDRPTGRFSRMAAVAPAPDETETVIPIVARVSEADPLRLAIDAETAKALGLVRGQLKGPGQILAREGIRPRGTTRADLESGLADARKRLERELEAIDGVRLGLDNEIYDAGRRRGVDDREKNRKAARSAMERIEQTRGRLGALEALTKEYPELLRGTPPGTSDVGLTEARRASQWFRVFQDRRDDLDDLKARANRLIDEDRR